MKRAYAIHFVITIDCALNERPEIEFMHVSIWHTCAAHLRAGIVLWFGGNLTKIDGPILIDSGCDN